MTSISTTKRVLAILAVTTALCADQAVVAATPVARTQGIEIGQIASRIVNRLARNFRRNLPAAIREPARQSRSADSASTQFAAVANICITHMPVSPFQFRLPPPTV